MKLRSKCLAVTLCLLGLCLLTASAAWAQLYSGSITGVVTDPSGAVVPGAKVTVQDVAKQVPLTVVTDGSGRYVVRALPPATYRLTVEMQGFSTYSQDRIAVEINQNLGIDVTLQVGAETQRIEVEATATALATQDATTGQELNRTFVNNLPLLDRNVFDLATLTPGVHAREASQGGINFVANGSRNSTSDILLDGVSATSFEQNSGILDPLYTPSVDSVQEFKVQTSNFSAEYGFSGSTIINMVTRSGSNQFHGSGWEFLRNNVLRSNNWFNNASGTPLSARRYNLFGAAIGGPIKKDKTFFFVDYEGQRDINAGTYNAGVPSEAMRNGNFGEICTAGFDSSGLCQGTGQLWDPYTGLYDPEAGGAVRSAYVPFNRLDQYQSPGSPVLNGTSYQPPATRGNLIDPVAKKIMSYFPLPNLNVGNADYNRFNNFVSADSSRYRNDQWDIKIDHNFSDRNRLSGKFSRKMANSTPPVPFRNALDPTGNSGTEHAHLLSLNFTRTMNASTVLNIAYGFTRRADNYTDAAFDVSELGLPDYMKKSGFLVAPALQIENYTSIGSSNNIGAQAWGILRQSPETHHLAAGMSKLHGAHDFRIGGEARMHRINEYQPGEEAGFFSFDREATSRAPGEDGFSGDEMASTLLGIPAWAEYEMPVFVSTQSFQFAGYFQDNWKVTNRLTLNIGIRYDLETPRTERFNRMSYVDPTAASPLQVPGLPNLKGVLAFANDKNRHNWGYDPNNFGPRFGFAYRFLPNSVLRGGYGIFYPSSARGAAGNGAYGFQGFDRYTPMITTYQGSGDEAGAVPLARLHDPFPGGPLSPPGSSLGGLSYVGESIRGPIKGMDVGPDEQSWSFGIQHQLPKAVLLDMNYVGKKGTHLYFAGANTLNHLGPEIESYSHDQITALNEMVPNPLSGHVSNGTPLGGETIGAYHLQLPFPQFDAVNGIAFPVANSIYHALQVRAEKRFSRGFQFLGTYTWSKSLDDSSLTHDGLGWLGGTTSLQDPNNYSLERSLSEFDVPHEVNVAYVYELPFGRKRAIGKNWSPVVDALLGGWITNGIWHYSRGFPIGLNYYGGVQLPTYGTVRPSLTGTLKRNTGSNFRDQYFANPEVVTTTPDFQLGTAPRTIGSARTPSAKNANLSVLKQFSMDSIREGMHLEYRAEFFNAFNTPQFCGPDTHIDGGSFGNVTCQFNEPREIQMALKFYW